jgi:hypothetical protein
MVRTALIIIALLVGWAALRYEGFAIGAPFAVSLNSG